MAESDGSEYLKLLEEARTSNLEEIEFLEFLDRSGKDASGRPLVVLYGKRLRVSEVDMKKVFLYFLREMDEVTKEDYTVIYFNSKASSSNYPSFGWLVYIYRQLPYRYRKNIASMSIVHPTLMTRFLAYSFYPFLSTKTWKKIHFADHVDELHLDNIIEPGEVAVPPETDEAQEEIEQYLRETEKAFEQGMVK